MPHVFLKDFPMEYHPDLQSPQPLDVVLAYSLRVQIAEAAECSPLSVKIHLSFTDNFILYGSGRIKPCHYIHGFVVWFGSEKRDTKTKQTIADALQDFLNIHKIGKDFDLTFVDMPAGSFFVEQNGKSVMVEGGEFLPPNILIAQSVYEVLGVETPGIITSD
jgi:hypothetical protein